MYNSVIVIVTGFADGVLPTNEDDILKPWQRPLGNRFSASDHGSPPPAPAQILGH